MRKLLHVVKALYFYYVDSTFGLVMFVIYFICKDFYKFQVFSHKLNIKSDEKSYITREKTQYQNIRNPKWREERLNWPKL